MDSLVLCAQLLYAALCQLLWFDHWGQINILFYVVNVIIIIYGLRFQHFFSFTMQFLTFSRVSMNHLLELGALCVKVHMSRAAETENGTRAFLSKFFIHKNIFKDSEETSRK